MNPVQKWALIYFLTQRKKEKYEDQQGFLKGFAYIHNPELAPVLFGNKQQDEMDQSAPISRDELSDIEAYLQGLESGRPVVAKIAFGGEWV